MEQKPELFKRTEQTWIIVTPKPKKLKFSPLIGIIDLYNNQQILKSYKNKKISLSGKEKSLVANQGVLSAKRFIIIPLVEDVKEQLEEIENAVADFKDKSPLIILSSEASENLASQLKKNNYSFLQG